MSGKKKADDATIRLTIDGREVEAERGMTVLQVCDREGIDVPRYCYHPGLTVAGNCRICMVEVEGMPNTQISCSLPAQEGMVVRTQSEAARAARRDVLELLLANHPVDCPVCDQAGECMLQDYYMEHARHASRLDDDKVHKRKAVSLGPHVMLDSERCILCSRCVRFTDEITKTYELGIFNRGDRCEIQTAPNRELDNNYSACTVDICPVGALTERDFRFQLRVWYLTHKPTVCPGCSRGCNIEAHVNEHRPYKAEGRRLLRIKPRYNPEVNGWWMCDLGRFGFDCVDCDSRLTRCMVAKDASRHATPWDSTIEETVRGLRAAAEAHGAGAVAALLSPAMTLEEMHAAGRVLREALGLEQIGFRVPPAAPAEADGLLLTADRSPNTAGAEKLGLESGKKASEKILKGVTAGTIKALLLWRHDLAAAADGTALLEGLRGLDFLAYAGTNDNPCAHEAHVVLPLAAWVERSGSFLNVDGRLQTFEAALEPLGDALPDFDVLLRLAAAAGVTFPYEGPAEALRELASVGGALAGADLEAACRLGHPWNIHGTAELSRVRHSPLSEDEVEEG